MKKYVKPQIVFSNLNAGERMAAACGLQCVLLGIVGPSEYLIQDVQADQDNSRFVFTPDELSYTCKISYTHQDGQS